MDKENVAHLHNWIFIIPLLKNHKILRKWNKLGKKQKKNNIKQNKTSYEE